MKKKLFVFNAMQKNVN